MEDVNSCLYLDSFGDILMFFRLWLSLSVSSPSDMCCICVPALGCTASEKYFVPLEKTEMNYKKAYIIWSNLQGKSVPEKEWHPNHVVTLGQNLPRGKGISYSWASPISRKVHNIAVCEDSEEDFLNISMLKVINKRLHVEVRFMLAQIQQQNGNKHLTD